MEVSSLASNSGINICYSFLPLSSAPHHARVLPEINVQVGLPAKPSQDLTNYNMIFKVYLLHSTRREDDSLSPPLTTKWTPSIFNHHMSL